MNVTTTKITEKVIKTVLSTKCSEKFLSDLERFNSKTTKSLLRGLKPSVTSNLVNTLEKSHYDGNTVIKMLEKHPELAKRLSSVKDLEGKNLFTEQDIYDILFNCRKTINKHPHRIDAVLNNPEEIASIQGWKCHGAGFWRSTVDPLASTERMCPNFWTA